MSTLSLRRDYGGGLALDGLALLPFGLFDCSGRGAARVEDAPGIPTQSHILPSIQRRDYGGGLALDGAPRLSAI